MSEAHSAVVLRKMSAKNWDDYRELISRWYISEKKTAPCIIEELQKPEHGFNVALYELKDRFATWRLRKNLSRPEQKCVVAVRKRKREEVGASIQEYTFGGQDLPEEKMKRLEYRLDHPVMSWGRYTHNLVISRPTLLALQHNQIYEWKPWKETPHELPWISFSRNTALLNSINHNLFGESSRPRMASSDSKFLLQSSPSQLGFGSSAIDKLSVSFSSLMPESREGENLARAKSLIRTRGELDMEMLKLVLFQLSNNFITTNDYENVVCLTERLGLGSPSVIRALFGVATRDLTIAAILDKLFIAACKTYSLKLVEVLVKENKEVLAFDMMHALNVSIKKRSIRVAKTIIAADTESTIGQALWNKTLGITHWRNIFLEELVKCKNDQFTSALVELLIPKITLLQDFLECLLFGALEAGNASLAIKSIECGADTCAKGISPVFRPLPDWTYVDSVIKATSLRLIVILDFHTVYTACIAPFSTTRNTWRQWSPEFEDIALETWEHMTASLGSHWSVQIGEESVPIDVLLSAAFLGYSSILKKFTRGPQDLNLEEILSKSATVEHLDAPLSGITPFQAALQTRNGPVCEALLAAGFNIDAKPENLSLAAGGGSAQVVRRLLRMLKTTSNSCTSESTKALQVAVKSGFPDIAEILIGEGVPLPSNWWHDVFGTYQLESLLSTLERIQCTQDVVEHAPQDGCSVLEAAMQNPHAGVAGFALDHFPQAYDSGALLARLCTGLSANESSPDALLDELIRRRDAAQDEDLTPVLENAAIALAAYFQKNDLLRALLERPQPHAPALVPGPDLWDIRLIHGEKPSTIDWNEPTPTMQRLLETAIKNGLGSGLWERCPQIVGYILTNGCLETLQLLTGHKEKVRNLYYDTARPYSGCFNGPKTALQLAIHAHRACDEMAYYLVGKGADVTAPANHKFGGTALQIAAGQGKITLARYLIGKGAQIDAPRAVVQGRTCLEAAAEAGRLDMIQFLLNEGTETEGKGRVQYIRAIHFARRRNHAAVEKLLRRHRHWDIPDHILDSQEFLTGSDSFLHPDEASFEKRRDVRQWCIENGFKPPFDAELDLLSSEESELPLRERMKTLAIIMDNNREISRKMLPVVNRWRGREVAYKREEAGYRYLVATEVEIMRRAMSTTKFSTESPNSSDAGEVDDSWVPCPDEDISDVYSHAEAVQENGSLSVHETVGADEDNRPRIHFHPEFNKRRDSVDFHETMHEEFLI
ncbi:uncharacterized protein PG998_006851 [Apiospora kogelbergensis]|uniref:uncharacterized protein n=1 Tax=Apiospora kogelbergensis TaxID=1337665 RepID=UPI0031313EE7